MVLYILLKYLKHFRDLVDVMAKFQGRAVDAAGGLDPGCRPRVYTIYVVYC